MGAVRRSTRAITRVTATSLMVLLVFAAVSQASVSPSNPVVGDTITVQGPGVECPSNAMPTFTFTLVLNNADGSTTTTFTHTQSGNGTSPPR
jgi:hypothetical protein